MLSSCFWGAVTKTRRAKKGTYLEPALLDVLAQHHEDEKVVADNPWDVEVGKGLDVTMPRNETEFEWVD